LLKALIYIYIYININTGTLNKNTFQLFKT
jgi:hypothetical protein